MAREPRDRDGRVGARASLDGGGGGGGRRGLIALLLGLLALILLVVLLVALIDGDDDGDGDNGGTATETEQPAGGGAPSGGGTLVAERTTLLSVPADGLRPVVGRAAQGSGVVVQSVVENEGFWVGSSGRDRLYVEYGAEVGENEPGSLPKKGDRVDLTGPVRAAPDDPERVLHLNAQDAELVRSQGAYINASTVTTGQ